MQLYSCTCCLSTYMIPLYKDTVPGSTLLLDHWGTEGMYLFYIQYPDYMLCSLLQKETKLKLIPSFKTINNGYAKYLIQILHLYN